MFRFGQSNWVSFIAQDSSLLALPGEIRNQIYELVSPDDSEVYISRELHHQPPPLSQVCQQLRREFYSFQPSVLQPSPVVKYYSFQPSSSGGAVRTVCFKAIDCDFRHVIKMCNTFDGFTGAGPECIKLILSLSNYGDLDWTLFAQLADSLFKTYSKDWSCLVPTGPSMYHGRWILIALVGQSLHAVRHELVVEMKHTAFTYLSCACSKLARGQLLFLPGRNTNHRIPSPRELLKKEVESAFRMSHDQWVIKMIEEKAAEKKRVKEAAGELEVLMRKLKIE